MASQPRTAAVGLLAERDFAVLRQAFRRLYRPDEDHDFGEVLARIDAAERRCARNVGWAACPG